MGCPLGWSSGGRVAAAPPKGTEDGPVLPPQPLLGRLGGAGDRRQRAPATLRAVRVRPGAVGVGCGCGRGRAVEIAEVTRARSSVHATRPSCFTFAGRQAGLGVGGGPQPSWSASCGAARPGHRGHATCPAGTVSPPLQRRWARASCRAAGPSSA